MPKNKFNFYLNSKILKNSSKLYFCNIHDLSPFFEPVSENYSMLNNLSKGFEVFFNRQSIINHYEKAVRTLSSEKSKMPLSSSYFELIKH